MNNISLVNFIASELSYARSDDSFIIAKDLADSLEINGYCVDPYFEYKKAFDCSINKRREKYCGCTHCASHEFCIMLRKEGYV